jgi:hypothetical protein
METLLDAMLEAYYGCVVEKSTKRERQLNVFRERILRMDAEKDNEILCQAEILAELDEQLAEKDAKIAELQEEVEYHKYAWTKELSDD